MSEKEIDPYLWYKPKNSKNNFVNACDYSGFQIPSVQGPIPSFIEWHRQLDGRLSKKPERMAVLSAQRLIADFSKKK